MEPIIVHVKTDGIKRVLWELFLAAPTLDIANHAFSIMCYYGWASEYSAKDLETVWNTLHPAEEEFEDDIPF
jgi:hypothetical protein